MAEPQTTATQIRKQPYTPGMPFVPQTPHTSQIPPRFEGQIPVNVPSGTFIPSFMGR